MSKKKQLKGLIGEFNPNQAPPKIDPVPSGIHRPLWSVMIPTFNCAKYLEKTLESVLCQDPGHEKMQIEVVDDCSTKDDPASVVKKMGKNRITFSRNLINTGLCSKNFNICLNKAKGHLVHLLHGDDYVLPGFYAMVENALQANPNAGMVINRCFVVDANGDTEILAEKVVKDEGPHFKFESHLYQNNFFAPGLVFKRSSIEKEGGFRTDLVHCADWEIITRVYSKYGALYLKEPKACYRIFPGNDTTKLEQSGENLKDYLRFLFALDSLKINVDKNTFIERVMHQAFYKAYEFKKQGNTNSFQENYKIYISTLKSLSLMQKIKWKIKRLKKTLREIFE